jgi:cytoskeletal protein RodZ
MTEIGERLKSAREEKQLTYEELQEITKIQKRYLVALEQGDYRVLPGTFYVRAFIKNYAEAVDLDPEELLEEYSHELPAKKETTTETVDFAPRSTRTSKTKKDNSKLAAIFPKILTILVVAGLIVVFWFVVQNYAGSGEQDESPQTDDITSDIGEGLPDESDSEENPVEDASDDPEPKEEGEPEKPKQSLVAVEQDGTRTTIYELTNASDFVVDITLSGDCYIRITNEKNETIEDGTFKGDQKFTFDLSESKEVTFNIGYSPNFQMTVNGEPFTFEIDPSERDHQYIVIKNIPAQENES